MSQQYEFKSKPMAQLVASVMERMHYLTDVEGIPMDEAHRVVIEEFSTLLNVNSVSNMNTPDWVNQPQENVLPDLTFKIPDTGYPPVLPFPVYADTQFMGNDGFDHKNPDPPGYAGGRDLTNLSQYQSNAPENKVIKSAPYPYDDQAKINYNLSPFTPPAQPSIHGEEGWVGDKAIPEWRYDVEQSQEDALEEMTTDKSLPQYLEQSRAEYLHKQSDGEIEMPHMVVDDPEMPDEPHMVVEGVDDLMEYVYQSHDKDDICNGFNGKKYDLSNRTNRPVPPSEGLGYTNTHPNCLCYWKPVTEGFKANKATKSQKRHLHHVNRIVGQKARHGTLHKIHRDGKLYKTTTNKNPIREAIEEIRHDFKWLSEPYMERILSLKVPGQRFLIRASSEAITDHRSEGEPHRRWLKADELHGMARTAIGKNMDLNHRVELRTKSDVLDSEFDPETNEIQMIVNEQDPEILKAIAEGKISAVSINGGAPRNEAIECDDKECFIVPTGVVLGELDNIALTWVVTDPRGIMYKGELIPPASPGVKTTAIQPL